MAVKPARSELDCPASQMQMAVVVMSVLVGGGGGGGMRRFEVSTFWSLMCVDIRAGYCSGHGAWLVNQSWGRHAPCPPQGEPISDLICLPSLYAASWPPQNISDHQRPSGHSMELCVLRGGGDGGSDVFISNAIMPLPEGGGPLAALLGRYRRTTMENTWCSDWPLGRLPPGGGGGGGGALAMPLPLCLKEDVSTCWKIQGLENKQKTLGAVMGHWGNYLVGHQTRASR